MSSSGRFAEKLLTLQLYGNEILTRLHRTYSIFSQDKTKPSLFIDPNAKKVIVELTKKFPELPRECSMVKIIIFLYRQNFFFFPLLYLQFVEGNPSLWVCKMSDGKSIT